MINIENYQPTPEEELLLAEHGLTAEQALTFNWPGDAELKRAFEIQRTTLILAIIRGNVRSNILEKLEQYTPLINELYTLTLEEIQAAYQDFLNRVIRLLEGNPYYGLNYTREEAEAVLAVANSTPWNEENLADELAKLLKMVEKDDL